MDPGTAQSGEVFDKKFSHFGINVTFSQRDLQIEKVRTLNGQLPRIRK